MIPRVYQAINAGAGELAREGVAKARLNSRDNYLYRSIDDVLGRLAPLLSSNRLCILPRVIERTAADLIDKERWSAHCGLLRVAFDLVSVEDGSNHTIEAYGEALDAGDKATAKAMQSAYKYAVLQAFCVPAAQAEDADAKSYRLQQDHPPAEPAEGWVRWSENAQRKVQLCSAESELQQLQDQQRSTLAALRRERPELYMELGQMIGAQKAKLKAKSPPLSSSRRGKHNGEETPALPVRRIRASRANGSSAHG